LHCPLRLRDREQLRIELHERVVNRGVRRVTDVARSGRGERGCAFHQPRATVEAEITPATCVRETRGVLDRRFDERDLALRMTTVVDRDVGLCPPPLEDA